MQKNNYTLENFLRSAKNLQLKNFIFLQLVRICHFSTETFRLILYPVYQQYEVREKFHDFVMVFHVMVNFNWVTADLIEVNLIFTSLYFTADLIEVILHFCKRLK
jgi:hypothetical protein